LVASIILTESQCILPRIELNGERELVWLTPHLRDPQPEGERERERECVYLSKCGTITSIS